MSVLLVYFKYNTNGRSTTVEPGYRCDDMIPATPEMDQTNVLIIVLELQPQQNSLYHKTILYHNSTLFFLHTSKYSNSCLIDNYHFHYGSKDALAN